MEVVAIATFAGLPAVSVPARFSKHGLPMGLQRTAGRAATWNCSARRRPTSNRRMTRSPSGRRIPLGSA
jgi:hypothetical protein